MTGGGCRVLVSQSPVARLQQVSSSKVPALGHYALRGGFRRAQYAMTPFLRVMAYCAVPAQTPRPPAQYAIAPRKAVPKFVDGAGAMSIAPYGARWRENGSPRSSPHARGA